MRQKRGAGGEEEEKEEEEEAERKEEEEEEEEGKEEEEEEEANKFTSTTATSIGRTRRVGFCDTLPQACVIHLAVADQNSEYYVSVSGNQQSVTGFCNQRHA